jgi:FAD/FMN-containing dehydrogenase
MRLPPGVSEPDFAEALRQFAAVVGKPWVLTSDEDVDTYRDSYSPLWSEPEEKVASAAVAPSSTEQVQEVVRIANRFKVPLYAISTGRNLAYGGSAPVLSGSVVLDLKRMNRVIELSEDNAYALVEPGVSYFDLYRQIRERGLKLWVDPPDPGWGSLMGNALDHGAGRTPLPYRDHFDAHCGMEVVLANGELVRTGMGALPTAKTWQAFKYGIGPYVDGIFSQSNLGVVTKMGFYLMPEPEACLIGRIRARRHDDIIPLMKGLARLTYENIVNCQFAISSPIFNGPREGWSAMLDQPDGGGADAWDAYAASRNTHFWQTELRFYGPLRIAQAQWETVKERLGSIADIVFQDGEILRFPLSDEQIRAMSDPVPYGVPSLNVFSTMMGFRGGPPTTGHLDASPILPLDGRELIKAHKVFARLFRDAGMEQFVGMAMAYHWRTLIMFQGVHVTHDLQENRRARDMYLKVIKTASENGWGIYRAHNAFHDEVLENYAFGDHALARLHASLKDALDPNGILSPGRYGMWPKSMRKARS